MEQVFAVFAIYDCICGMVLLWVSVYEFWCKDSAFLKRLFFVLALFFVAS